MLAAVCSNAVEMRNKFKDAFLKKHGVKLGFMSPFIRASAFALQDQPTVNAVIEGTEIVYRDYVDISVAVATPKVSRVMMYNFAVQGWEAVSKVKTFQDLQQ